MKILDFLSKEDIIVNLKALTKKEIIIELVDVLIKSNKIAKKDKAKIVKALMDRERLGSTGIGQGIAIPHAKNNAVNREVVKSHVDLLYLDVMECLLMSSRFTPNTYTIRIYNVVTDCIQSFKR